MVATVAGIHLGLDTHANRPAANTAPDGSMYSCSTHGLIYKSNFAGNSWSTWATLGGAAVDDATIVTSDITTNNASTTKHGWLRKLSGVATEYLDGSGAWSTPAGVGGGSSLPLDDFTPHATYGDHFAAATLDAKWTRRVLTDPAETFDDPDSWMRIVPMTVKDFGHLQPYTPKAETEIRMKASIWTNGGQTGFGPIIVDSAGTGLWLAFRESTRMGLFAVPAYVTPTEPTTANLAPASQTGGGAVLGEGRIVWFSLIKKGGIYYFRFSMDGVNWTNEMSGHAPSAFTPDRIGWYVGAVAPGILHRFSVDWFDVVNDFNVGNNLMITPTSGTVTPSANNAPSIGVVGNVIDGNTAGTGWADVNSNATIWWMATFSVAQDINRLRLWGYSNAWGKGYVEFSSGTKIPFHADASRIMHLDFPTESTTFVKVWCNKQGEGTFPGFFEIEAYLAS